MSIQNSDSALDESDESLAELLTLTCEVGADGTIIYRNSEGQPHRIHGPAVIYNDRKLAWYSNGQIHRADGPAVIFPDGYRAWYSNGRRHRVGGPAVIHPNGDELWFEDGICVKRISKGDQ